MIFSLTYPLETCFAGIPSRLDASIPDPFVGIDTITGDFIAVVTAYPFNKYKTAELIGLPFPTARNCFAGSPYVEYTGVEEEFRAGTGNYYSISTDSPASSYWPGLIEHGYQISFSLGPSTDPLGAASTVIGNIDVLNGDGNFDRFVSMSWGGRNISIQVGGKSDPLSGFATAFNGVVISAPINEQSLTISMQSRLSLLAVPLPILRYAGTGGKEGPTSLTNAVVPEIFGVRRQVGLIMLDQAKQIFQVCREASIIENVKNRGLAVTFNNNDYADYDALSASSSPAAGYYSTCVAEGLLRFGTVVSVPTCDVTGPVDAGTYATTIIQYIIATRSPNIFTGSDTDVASFNNVLAERPYDIGIYVQSEITCLEICQQAMQDIGGYILTNRNGDLSLGLYQPMDSYASTTLTCQDTEISGPTQSGELAPVRNLLVYYQPRTRPLGDSDISDVADEDDRESLKKPYASLDPIDALSTQRNAVDYTFTTSLDLEAAASDVGNDLLAYLKLSKELQIPITNKSFVYWLGDTVLFKYPRFGFDSGGVFVKIVAIEEDFLNESGSSFLVVRYDPDTTLATYY